MHAPCVAIHAIQGVLVAKLQDIGKPLLNFLEEIELLQSECDNWKIRTEFVSKRLHRFIKKSDQDENVGGARIAERKEQDCIKMLKSELQMEREHVQRLKLELEEITHGATIRVEEARLAEMRKQEKCIRMLMSEMTKMRKNLKEERKRDKTNQIAIKKVEEITLDLANARNDLASAISRAEVAEAKLSDLEKKIRLTDDKYICAICLENEKDMAFSCGHMRLCLEIKNVHVSHMPEADHQQYKAVSWVG
ncbi:hypothetical protein RJT34_01710 [Clitoria ternatea]|uniref:Uncharacterized protein n=1 Tax=Clitoria ternatea TaxID=43366 RepID=A0AAN9KJ82_CLITE